MVQSCLVPSLVHHSPLQFQVHSLSRSILVHCPLQCTRLSVIYTHAVSLQRIYVAGCLLHNYHSTLAICYIGYRLHRVFVISVGWAIYLIVAIFTIIVSARRAQNCPIFSNSRLWYCSLRCPPHKKFFFFSINKVIVQKNTFITNLFDRRSHGNCFYEKVTQC